MNRATTKGIKRIRESAWCCGANYQRWRFVTGKFPITGQRCAKCNSPLEFERVKNPGLARYYRIRLKNYMAGLTVLGTKYQRHPNFLHQSLSPISRKGILEVRKNHIRKQVRENARKRMARFVALGLTSRGTKPKINRGGTEIEKQWRQLRSEIQMPISADWEMFVVERNMRRFANLCEK